MKKVMMVVAFLVAAYAIISVCLFPLMGASAIMWPMMILAMFAMAKHG